MIVRREWAMPNKYTFLVAPIAELLSRYVRDGKGWIDPFAGMASPAELTNDLDPDMVNAASHVDALDFVRSLTGSYKGVLFDPPYSLRQMQECYKKVGMTGVPFRHTTNFYGDLRVAIASKIRLGGLAVSCGWNSIGMGKTHGFEILEVLLVCHGRAHNDTIVTVDLKVREEVSQ